MPMTDEQLKRLPYHHEKPATAQEVVKEFSTLAAVVAGVVSAGGPTAGAMLEDTTKEPGRTVQTQEIRTMLALSTYVNDQAESLLTDLAKAAQAAFPMGPAT